jgi:hypothetical protein
MSHETETPTKAYCMLDVSWDTALLLCEIKDISSYNLPLQIQNTYKGWVVENRIIKVATDYKQMEE